VWTKRHRTLLIRFEEYGMLDNRIHVRNRIHHVDAKTLRRENIFGR
jgi:hypothetical protein